jgi:hypothetical protein
MKSLLKILLGFNAISLIHLIRLKPMQVLDACKRAFSSSLNSVHNSAAAIPEISLGEILGERKPFIRMSVMRYEDGMLPSDQAVALLAILVAEAPKEVLEIGTYMGHTTRQIVENLEMAIIHTVDLPEHFSFESDPNQYLPKDDFHLITRRIVGREFMRHPCANRIKQHFGDTASWDFRDAGHPTFFLSTVHIHTNIAKMTLKSVLTCAVVGEFFSGMIAITSILES